MLGNAYLYRDIIFVITGIDRDTVRATFTGSTFNDITRIETITVICMLPYSDYTDILNDIIFPAGTLFSFDCTLLREYRMHLEKEKIEILGKRIGKIKAKYMPFFYTAVSATWGEKPFPPERNILYEKLREIGKDYFEW